MCSTRVTLAICQMMTALMDGQDAFASFGSDQE
jgi:hypothetical protein